MNTETIARALVLTALAAAPCLAQGFRAAAPPTGSVTRTVPRIVTRLEGEVRLADGSAVAGATLSTGGAHATSDANGFFVITQDVTLGQTIVVEAAARILGANHRGAAAPVQVLTASVDVGTITLERLSVPIYFSPLQYSASSTLLASADIDGDGDTDFVCASGQLENGPDGFVETPLSLGLAPSVVATLDLDRDGDVDLLVKHSDALGQGLAVVLNDGQGHFGPALPATHLSGSEAHGDFDGDRIPDLVLVTTGGLSFLHGNGDGTFAAPQVQAVSVPVGQALALDLDGDHDLDLALASDVQLALLLGSGDGTFAAPYPLSLANDVSQLLSGDLDGDGVVDLLALTYLYNPEVLEPVTRFAEPFLAQGGGAFVAGVTTWLGTTVVSASLGELSGDGRADLILAESAPGFPPSGWLRVRRGRGDGSFLSSSITYKGASVAVIGVEDFDADGRLDVLASGVGELDGLTVCLGRGDGTLVVPELLSGANRAASAADFDLDGDLDLLLLDPLLDRAQISRSGNGHFTPIPPFVDLQPEGHQATGDLDGDADLDVIVIHELTSAAVLLHDGAGHLSLDSTFVVGNAPRPMLEDFDVDGDLDLAFTSNSNGGEVYVYPGNGDGTFAARSVSSAGGQPLSVVAGDWDADGAPDLVLRLSTLFADYWGGNGDGTFRAPVRFAATGDLFGPRSACDVNGDGALDLVTRQAVLLGRGDGSFEPALTNGIGSEAIFDVDGDGRLDLASTASGVVRLHLGHGDGTFSNAFTYARPMDEIEFISLAVTPTLGDLDGDGDADLLLGQPNPAAVPYSYLLRGRRVP